MKQPRDELRDLFKRRAVAFRSGVVRLAESVAALRLNRPVGVDDHHAALRDLGKTIGETMAIADMLGRRRAILEAEDKGGEFQNAIVPSVDFEEAIADIARRVPKLAQTGEAVARLYSTQHAMAFAYSVDLTLTEKVQDVITRLQRSGLPVTESAAVIERMTDWTAAYSRTVYRTNLNTAYTAGRFQQAADPEVAEIMPAFERLSVLDSDTRSGAKSNENHRAGHGLIAATDDPVWDYATPPSGYNCRCTIRLVSTFELKRKGLVDDNGKVKRHEPPGFANFKPHPRFGRGRPDRRLYGLGQFAGRPALSRFKSMWRD